MNGEFQNGELVCIWESIWGHLNFCPMGAHVAFPAKGKGEETRDLNSPPPAPIALGWCLPLHQFIHLGLGPTTGAAWDPGESAPNSTASCESFWTASSKCFSSDFQYGPTGLGGALWPVSILIRNLVQVQALRGEMQV